MTQHRQPITIKMLVNGEFHDIYANDLRKELRRNFSLDIMCPPSTFRDDSYEDMHVRFLATLDDAEEVVLFINHRYELQRSAEII